MQAFMDREWKTSNQQVFGREVDPKELGAPVIVLARSVESKKIVGIASCKIIGQTVRIYQLLTKTEYRFKAGIGTRLLQRIEHLCRKEQWHKIRLSTSEKHQTEEFYKSNGYSIEATLENDAFGWTWYIYSKFIE